MLRLLHLEDGGEPQRHEESPRHEEEQLGRRETPVGSVGERPEDRERMPRVQVELGPLVPLLDVFHREVVEVQLLLECREIVRARLDGVDPDPLTFSQIGHRGAELIERDRHPLAGPRLGRRGPPCGSVPEPLADTEGRTRPTCSG